MTFGIDIAGFQAGMDLVKAKSEGVEFVIVKASGFNVAPPYVADGYHAHIDNAIAAGLPKGHYYLIGGGQEWLTPTEQARWFVSKLYRFNVLTDVLMLDNEGLNANGYLFDDGEAAEFLAEVIRLTGISPNRVWHYAGAVDYRSLGPWPLLEALCVRFVWAAYGSYPTGQTPDHEPSLQGSISRWDVHQFTSRALVAGKSVDGNYATASILELFGGTDVGYLEARPAKGNMNQGFGPRPRPTPTSPAIHYGQDYGWGGGDAIYAARGGVVTSYGSSGSYGNRVVVDHGGGRQTWYCHLASSLVGVGAVVDAGEQIGWMGATGNVTAKHLHFELRINGVATDPAPYFGTTTTAGGGTAPVDNAPAPKPIDLGDIMARYLWAQNRGGILITETDGVFFPSMAGTNEALAWEYRAAQKLLFNGIDVDTRVWDVARQDALDRQSAAGRTTNDKITAAINAAIDAKLTGDLNVDADVEIDVEAIATAVREKLRTDPLK